MLNFVVKGKKSRMGFVPQQRAYGNRFKPLECGVPNLGFDPSLLKDKPFIHDHPERPASEFIKKVPPIISESRVVACDGLEEGESVLGHPRVFINLDKSRVDDATPCQYCGKKFILRTNIPKGHPILAGYVIPENSHHH